MVEFGNSLDPDKEFDVLHGILDFTVDDCLKEGEILEDWNIGDAQCLGPIPSNILKELPMASNEELKSDSIAVQYYDDKSDVALLQRKLARVQESGSFHTQSAVSVLESCGSCSREKSLSIKSDNAIPARRSKRLRDKSINRELSTSNQTSNARRSKESRKRLPVAMDLMRNSPKNVDNSLNVSDHARQTASESCPEVVKKCAHCQSSETTLWRAGPLGPRTLCNACGLRYRSGRLCSEYRPLLSPTFVPSQHSNSHKKAAEMRNEAKRLKVEIKIDGVSDQTQLHVDDTSMNDSLTADIKNAVEYNDDNSDVALLQNSSDPCPAVIKKCTHCESTKTPRWQNGPLGSLTLCNACGLQYRAGCLVPEYRPRQCWPSADVKIAGPPEQKHVERMQLAKHVETSTRVSFLESSPLLNSRSKHFKHAGKEKSFEMHVENDDRPLDGSDGAVLQNASDPAVIKKCAHCESTKRSVWKRGPLGPGTLCNACGLQYRAGNLVPGYRPRQFRPRPRRFSANIKIDGAPELAKHVAASSSLIHPQTDRTPEQKQVEHMHVDTSSHVSLLESSCSYSKYVSKHVKHMGAKQCVSPPSPCKKASCEEKLFEVPVENDDDNSDAALLQNASGPCPAVIKKCTHCQSTKTPQWRGGPLGPRTLCNACGTRYKAGRLVPEYRPKPSATFMPSQHSKDNRNIEKIMQSTASIEKCCAHCESTNTPVWLEGPLGPGTLCNACGKKYTAGRLVPEYRPKASPTFVPSQHSNKYRTCLKMRAKTTNDSLTADIKISGAPEQKHVEGMQLAKHVETSTHVSLLESSPSYLKFKAKYFKHAGEHAPCVPPPSPCKKTSSVENYDDNSDGALVQNASVPCPAVIKKCVHCESTKTPRWKRGPLGPSTLCNSCSYQYQAGRLVPEYRPKGSPTFMPGLHSNNPRNIFQMMQSTAGIEKRCAHCESTKTSKWTSGPLGPSTLCNACGKQYKAGRLVPEYRPKASPTFVTGQHSNFASRLVKMGTKPMQ